MEERNNTLMPRSRDDSRNRPRSGARSGTRSGIRSKSLGRKPCKAIAEMAHYFQEEASLSQVGRAGRPRSASPTQPQPKRPITPPNSRHQQHQQQQQTVSASRRSQPSPEKNLHLSRSTQARPPVKREQTSEETNEWRPHAPIVSESQPSYYSRQTDQRGERHRLQSQQSSADSDENKSLSSPRANSGAIKQFISLYNDIDKGSRYLVDQQQAADDQHSLQLEEQIGVRQYSQPVKYRPGATTSNVSIGATRSLPEEQRPTAKSFRDQQTNTESSYGPGYRSAAGPNKTSPRQIASSSYETKAKALPTSREKNYRGTKSDTHSLSPRSRPLSEEGDVDDRPLTASAWKAWLGESSNKSSLEKKVETAFSRHVTSKENEIHRAEPFRISSPPAVEQQSAGRRGDHSHAEKVKSVPLWKVQNQLAAAGKKSVGDNLPFSGTASSAGPVRESAVRDDGYRFSQKVSTTPPPPPRMADLHTDQERQPQRPSPSHSRQNTFIEHQADNSSVSGSRDANLDYHPYANSDFHAEQKILPNPEDNYAQIQKRRPPIQQEPYHTPPAQYESYPIPRAADTEQCYHQTDNMSYEPPYSVPRDEYPPTNQALLIQVPPPKPGRSAERIDHGYAPENIGPGYAPDRVYASQSDEQLHVSRQSMPESIRQFPRQAVNLSYMDPYVSQLPEPYTNQPPPEPYTNQQNGGGDPYSYSQMPADRPLYNQEPYTNGSYNYNYAQQPYENPSPPITYSHYPAAEYMHMPADSYRHAPQHPTQSRVSGPPPAAHPNYPAVDQRADWRPYHTLDSRYTGQQRYDRRRGEAMPPRDYPWYSATTDRRSYPFGSGRPNHNSLPSEVPELRHSRGERVDVGGQARQARPPTHQSHVTAEVHHEPRAMPRHPDLSSSNDKHQAKRQHKSKSAPNSRASSSKHASDSKPSSKDKNKHNGSSKSNRNKEEKKSKQSAVNLPDFIPIHHVAPAAGYQPPPEPSRYDYGPHQARLVQAPNVNRGRPGVGVMFNPDMGVTDF